MKIPSPFPSGEIDSRASGTNGYDDHSGKGSYISHGTYYKRQKVSHKEKIKRLEEDVELMRNMIDELESGERMLKD